MTPGMVTAIAYLVAEAATAGVQISQILREAQATGKVPPERWDAIIADLKAARDLWDEA